MREGSSQIRLRYGAGRLIGLLRLAMPAYPTTDAVQRSNPTPTLWHSFRNETRTILSVQSMPGTTYTLFRDAILGEQQVVCSYDGRVRELCPHIIGTNKRGEEVVLAWQFAGESSGPLPQWRCLRLANVRNARARNGRWHEGGSHRTEQTCVSEIDLDINIHVRKRR